MSEQPPILPIPSWAVAIGVATFFGICTAVGYWKNAENLNAPKKTKKGKNYQQEIEKMFGGVQSALKKGSFDEAESLLLEILPLVDKIPHPNNLSYIFICNRQLANIYRAQKNFEGTEKHLLRALSAFEGRELEAEEEDPYSDTYEFLIETYYVAKNEEKAIMHLIKWVSFLEKRRSSNFRRRVPTVYLLIGKNCMDKKNFIEAEEYFGKGIKTIEITPSGAQSLPKDDVYFQLQLLFLQALVAQKKRQEVLKNIPKVISSFASKEPLEQATLYNAIAERLFELGEYEESLKLLDTASVIFEKVLSGSSNVAREHPPISAQLHELQTRRSAILSALGRMDEARETMISLARRLHGVPPAMISKYLSTKSSYVHKGDENFIKFEGLFSNENQLPLGSLLLAKFETDDHQILEIDHEITDGSSSVALTSPALEHVTEDKYYLIDISIYKDNTKSELIGAHYQLARILSEPTEMSQEEVQKRIMQTLLSGGLE